MVFLTCRALRVSVICKKAETVSVSFIDNGKPFNPLTDSEAPDIGAGLDERKIGGLGIHIVKEMMDSVEYARNDNKNIFTIKISG